MSRHFNQSSPRYSRQISEKGQGGENKRVFSENKRVIETVKDIALQQNRDENEVFETIIDVGITQILGQKEKKYQEAWEFLSPREREVAELISRSKRHYEISMILMISYDTVRAHAKHIYKKFGLSNRDDRQARNEFRRIMRDYNLVEWWADQQY